ncbi:MAG: plasmid maintenance system killer family protein [Parcubacteria group bacterium]|nr:plasmid maintenance system killer family protein [Parcubacteria group bacterium]|tara:strand:+ start:464 stop:739 length:276 start_codon:yes stop_codon:yes gene_type:complete
MIASFKKKDTERIFARERVRSFSAHIQHLAYRKLLMLDAAAQLSDLKVPPGNHLKRLKTKDLYSIRINKQWRICFRWLNNAAYDVHIIDYH